MQNDIFNSRPVFYSEKFDYKTHFLLDFKKLNLQLNRNYIKSIVTDKRSFDLENLQLSIWDPRYFQYIEGVDCLYEPPKFSDNKTTIAELKNTINKVLIENLSKIKNERVLLMLSGGIDSQMILHYCLDLGVNFTALYISSSKTKQEKEYLQALSISKKFNLIVLEKEDVSQKFTNEYSIKAKNPPFQRMYFYGNTFYYTLLKKFDFSMYNVITGGFESEVALDQIYQTLYTNSTTKETIDNWNQEYGCYMHYSFDPVVKESIEKLFSYNQLQRLNYRITQSRNYSDLEHSTGKIFYTPYKDSRLIECAVNLSYIEKIENAYKKPCYELLQENFKFTPQWAGNFKDPSNVITYNNIDREGYGKHMEYHKQWIKNYLTA